MHSLMVRLIIMQHHWRPQEQRSSFTQNLRSGELGTQEGWMHGILEELWSTTDVTRFSYREQHTQELGTQSSFFHITARCHSGHPLKMPQQRQGNSSMRSRIHHHRLHLQQLETSKCRHCTYWQKSLLNVQIHVPKFQG